MSSLPVNIADIPVETEGICLHMENNIIASLTDTQLQRIFTPALTSIDIELYLSNNIVSSLDIDWLPDNLRLLYLDSNLIVSVSRNMLDTFIKLNTSLRLKLGNNPYQCNCNASEFVDFSDDHYAMIDDVDDVKCSDDEHGEVKIREINLDHCMFEDLKQLSILSISILVVMVIILIIITVNRDVLYNYTLGYNNRWLYNKESPLKLYLSYSKEDEMFAMNLKKELTTTFDLEILTSDDVEAGDVIVVERTRLVQQCHFLMIILSQHYDMWTEFDLICGHARSLGSGSQVSGKYIFDFVTKFFFLFSQ